MRGHKRENELKFVKLLIFTLNNYFENFEHIYVRPFSVLKINNILFMYLSFLFLFFSFLYISFQN